jgi:hypothetical protein
VIGQVVSSLIFLIRCGQDLPYTMKEVSRRFHVQYQYHPTTRASTDFQANYELFMRMYVGRYMQQAAGGTVPTTLSLVE